MRRDHYLNMAGYEPRQLVAFERERIFICVMCATESRSIEELGHIVGIYQAKKLIADLCADGYLQRVMRQSTGDILYKLKPEAIGKRAFFMER